VLFNDAVSYYSYRALTTNELMSTEQWWHDNDSSKLKYCDKILSQRHFVHRKSHVEWPGMKLASPQDRVYAEVDETSTHSKLQH
jgi:hypothetical protein